MKSQMGGENSLMRSSIIPALHEILVLVIVMIKSGRLRLVVHMKEMINAYKIWLESLKWKRAFGRPRHRWKDNIKMDFREIGSSM
jgi:hypothetical protein